MKPWASQMVLVEKNLPAHAGDVRDVGSIPGYGRSPGGGHGNPFQYSCLENPTDRGAWRATVHNVTKSQICTHAMETTCWAQSGSSPPLEEFGGEIVRAFPWWLNGKRIHLPMQEKQVISLIWEDPTGCGAKKPVHHNYWACAPEPKKPNYWAHMPQLLKTSHPKECVPQKERYHEKPVNHSKE